MPMRFTLVMEYKERFTKVFEHMGPERVARGLTAQGYDWSSCFLAAAYERSLRSNRWAANVTGLADADVQLVATAWDSCTADTHGAFVALAQEWLETNRTQTPSAVAV